MGILTPVLNWLGLEASHTRGTVSPFAPRDTLGTLVGPWTDLEDYIPVTRSTAMSIAAVAKARHTITGPIARFPLVAMNGANPLRRQPIICTQPEAGRPRAVTMTWAIDAMVFFGRVWFVVRERYAEDQRPRRVEWVPEWEAETDDDGVLVKAFGKPVLPRDVIRVDGPHEGLLNFAAKGVREAFAIDRAAANASANPVPSVELHQTGGDPMTNPQIDELTKRWERARAKSGVGFTNQSVELKTHGQPVEQLLIDGRNVAALNLARSMGLPAWAIDAFVQGSSLSYSNAPSRSRELIDYGLMPYMNAFEARWSMDDILPHGVWARFDVSDLLRGDFKARMDGYKVAIEAGIYSKEECRAMETGTILEEGSTAP